ncbi:hypothetical protein ACI8AG_02360 [Blastococcus sp. SYSU DS0552]
MGDRVVHLPGDAGPLGDDGGGGDRFLLLVAGLMLLGAVPAFLVGLRLLQRNRAEAAAA